MSLYTAKYLRELLEDVPDDEAVAGILFMRVDQSTDGGLEITPEQWEKIENLHTKYASQNNGAFDQMREALIDAITEICPDTEESEVIAPN